MTTELPREILTIDEAAALLGVSVKTFNKVLHSQSIPARKIGREWKFSRQALIHWVGSGNSLDFYHSNGNGHGNGHEEGEPAHTLDPLPRPREGTRGTAPRRTSGWQVELD